MAVKITLDDEAMKRAQELGLDAVDPEAMRAAAAAAAVDSITASGELAARHLAQAVKAMESRQATLYAAIPQSTWADLAESMLRAGEWAQEYGRNMRLSAVYAVGQVWDLLAELAPPDVEEDPPFTEADAIGWALEAEKGAGDALAAELLESNNWGKDDPKGRFVARLREHVAAMRDAVGMGDGVDLPETEETAMRPAAVVGEPLLWLDEAFAVYLDGMGGIGPDLAGDVREKARERWTKQGQGTIDGEPENGRMLALWFDMEAGHEERSAIHPFLQRLAMAVWRDVVRPKMEEERAAERKRAIEFMPYMDSPNLDLFVDALFSDGRTMEVDGRRGAILSPDGRPVAHIAQEPPSRRRGGKPDELPTVDARVLETLREAMLATARTPFIRTYNYAMARGFDVLEGDPDATGDFVNVCVEGGAGQFAELAQIGDEKEARMAIRLGRVVELPLPGGRTLGGLWLDTSKRGNRYGPGYLTLHVRRELIRMGGPRVHRVPLLEPSREPALPRDYALHAPTLIAVPLLFQHMRTHWAELLRDGGAPWSPDIWRRILGQVNAAFARGEGKREREDILGALRDGDDNRPALLDFPEPDAVTLNAEAYGDVLDYLKDGASRSQVARGRGRKAAANRKEKAAGKPPRKRK